MFAGIVDHKIIPGIDDNSKATRSTGKSSGEMIHLEFIAKMVPITIH